jgi:hypothetical protein
VILGLKEGYFMRKPTIILLALCCMAMLVACTQDPLATNNNSGYTIDYFDAASFEKALSEGEKVSGKIVQFFVIDYKLDSVLGIDIWGGEHLNFIVEEELDVKAGDIVTGRVTKEASQIILLGSWKIPFEVLKIEKRPEESSPNEPESNSGTTGSTVPMPTEPEPTETRPRKVTVTMSEEDFFMLTTAEAEEKLREMGFTVFEHKTCETDANIKKDGKIGAVEIKTWFLGNGDFSKGDIYDSDAIVVLWTYVYTGTEPFVEYSVGGYIPYKSDRVYIYFDDETHTAYWGSKRGSTLYTFKYEGSISTDRAVNVETGEIYIIDAGQIKRFTADGRELSSYSILGYNIEIHRDLRNHKIQSDKEKTK